jgi:putative ubiquitin-RnfH superfamily antitoxin RatB of RatAB toxin-antitoxin module
MVVDKINVEVTYVASAEQQSSITVQVPPDCTVENAILQSGILRKFPKIDLQKNKVGIFGQLATLTASLREGDRIEIYKPLIIDPKHARRLRALKQKKKRIVVPA